MRPASDTARSPVLRTFARGGAALAAALLLGAFGPGHAATTPVEAAAAERDAVRKTALGRASDATVGIEATAVEDARSIGTLGKERQGSGVVIGDEGLVLTIGYLILEADHVDIVLDGGRRVPGRVVAYDLASGFGLVQSLAPLSVKAAPLGASASVRGDEPLLFASGGDGGALSLAKMVSRRPFAGYWEYHIDGALFTVPARGDHSGAGLFNVDGELVGIGSLVVTDPAGGDAAPASRGNMFVPIDLLKPVLAEMVAEGASRKSRRPWVGLNCVEYAGQVRVIRLTPESPAEEAGIRPGDVVAAVDGQPVSDLRTFYQALWQGDRSERTVRLDVRRGAETLRLEVRAVDRMRTLRKPQGV